MNPLPPDPYKALGVDRDADLPTIKTTYRKLVLKCHPDKVQDPALKALKQNEFQRVQQAYEILGDETKRKQYDDEVKLRKLRESIRNMQQSQASTPPRPSSKNYSEFVNVRTADPPSSFKPSPTFSSFPAGTHKTSKTTTSSSAPGPPPFTARSWEHDIPMRSKTTYDEEQHRARRAASYEKPKHREESKEERRRRKEKEAADYLRDRSRDKEREKERERQRRSDKDKEDKREKQKKEAEKRDKQRRQEQDDKIRRKATYVEPHSESDGEHRVSKKKSSASAAAASGSNNSSKKHTDSPRRDKATHQDESLRDEQGKAKVDNAMLDAANYMFQKRRGFAGTATGTGTATGAATGAGAGSYANGGGEGVAYSAQFPNPSDVWQNGSNASRARHVPQDERRYRPMDIVDDKGDAYLDPRTPQPRLRKTYTSPAGLQMPSSSAHRVSHLSRNATMDFPHYPPSAPLVPGPDTDRHSLKSERRRRGSVDIYDDDMRPRRMSGQGHGSHHPSDIPMSRTMYTDITGDYYLPGTTPGSRPMPGSVKYSPAYSPEQVYQAKPFSSNDVAYSTVYRSTRPDLPRSSYVGV